MVTEKPRIDLPTGEDWKTNLDLLRGMEKMLRENGASLREIGRATGLSHNGVKMRLERIGLGVKTVSYLYDLETGRPIFPFEDEDLRVDTTDKQQE